MKSDLNSKDAQITSAVGFFLLAAITFIIPIFFVPPQLLQLPTIAAEIQFLKHVLLRLLAGLLFVVTIAHLFMFSFARLRGALLSYIFLGAFILASLVAVLLSEQPLYGMRQFYSELVLLLIVACAPLYMANVRRVQIILFLATIAAAIVAAIAVVSALVTTEFYEFIYGADPIAIAREGQTAQMGSIEGGARRAATMATLGNPEFSGNYFAAGLLLAGCWVLDGFGSCRLRSLPGWVAGLFCAGLLFAAMILTQTRSALIVVAAGLIVRWLVGWPMRGWIIAAWLLVVVGAGVAFGFIVSMIIFVTGLLGFFLWQIKTGQFANQWSAIPRRTRILLIAVPVAAVLVLIVAILFDPLRVRLFSLFDRLLSVTSTLDRSVRERLTFYMLAGEMFLDNPIFGVGIGYYPAFFHDALVRVVESDPTGVMAYNQILLEEWIAYEAHSDYFQMAAERGIVGLATFLGLVTALVTGLVRMARTHANDLSCAAHAIVVIICGFMAMMMFSFPLHEAVRMTTFFILCGAGLAALTLRRVNTKEAKCANGTKDTQ